MFCAPDAPADRIDEYSERLLRMLELRDLYVPPERTLAEVFSDPDANDIAADTLVADARLGAVQNFADTLRADGGKLCIALIRTRLRERPELRVVLLELFDTWPFCCELAKAALANRPKLIEFRQFKAAIAEFDRAKAPLGESPTDWIATLFYLREDLAQNVASTIEIPVPFQMAFRRELACIAVSRGLRIGRPSQIPGHSCWTQAANGQLFGVALSGGGIRSATFNLGILQGLSEVKVGSNKERRLLHLVDYLSTVSGGGYIGSWLHSWILRSDRRADPQTTGLDRVIANLSPEGCPDPEADPQQPIKFLRRYSRYLAPEAGFLSADTWTVVSIWLRNTSLNLLILTLGLSALLLLPRILERIVDISANGSSAWIAALLLLMALGVAGLNLSTFTDPCGRRDILLYQQKGVQLLFVAPVWLAATILSASYLWAARRPTGDLSMHVSAGVLCASLLFLLSLIGRYQECWYDDYGERDSSGPRWGLFRKWTGLVLCALASGAVAIGLSWLLEKIFSTWFTRFGSWFLLTLGPTVVMTFLFAVIVCHIGLLGRNLPDDRREWWGRTGAYIMLYGLGWPTLCAIALWSPAAVAWSMASHWAWATSSAAAWVVSTVSGVLAGKSKVTGEGVAAAKGSRSPILEIVAGVTPYVFIAGLLILLSFGIQTLTLLSPKRAAYPTGKTGQYQFEDAEKLRLRSGTEWRMPSWRLLGDLPEEYLCIVPWWQALGAASTSLLLAFVLAWRVNVNEFSMHHYYKNRLVRCYLGASQRLRRPNRFTGIDPDDDQCLGDFTPRPDSPLEGVPRAGAKKTAYSGPYPIINAALNLVRGDELAWQDRKAQSFMFTPEFCGYATTPTREIGTRPNGDSRIATYGFRPTRLYAYPDAGIHLGSAMAISGAAASPNEGYNTSPANAFLMTVFNVRLGWWISNTRDLTSWRRATPAWGLFYLLSELFAATNNKSSFLYLTDGGHFENLGLYELVHRRCAFIICCDASQDGDLTFEDLAGAIRKCRTDYGAEITIGVKSLKKDPDTGLSKNHCVVGKIDYNDGKKGVLVYIKPALTGGEPADVAEYRTAHPEFPHESTLDQFFTESQFESYRKLGYYTVRSIFEKERFEASGAKPVAETPAPPWPQDPLFLDLRDLFDELDRRWYPSNEANRKSFTRLAGTFDQLTERIRKDPKLARLSSEFYPELQELDVGRTWQASFRDEFYYCLSLIQLIEDVYLDLNLEENFDHPDNKGWINTFHRWISSATFQRTWLVNSGLFGSRFRVFMGHRFGLKTGSPAIAPLLEDVEGDQRMDILLRAEGDAIPPVVIGSVRIRNRDLIVWVLIDKPYRRLGWAIKTIETLIREHGLTVDLDLHDLKGGDDLVASEALRQKMQRRSVLFGSRKS